MKQKMINIVCNNKVNVSVFYDAADNNKCVNTLTVLRVYYTFEAGRHAAGRMWRRG